MVSFAYLAAVYLTGDARRLEPRLVTYFARACPFVRRHGRRPCRSSRLFELETSAPRTADRLTQGLGLPFLVVSFVLGGTVLAGLLAGRTRWLRYVSAGAFAAMLWGWAVAQYPAMLPGSLTLYAASAPSSSLVSEFVVVGVIALVVLPSFLLLFRLSQRGLLAEDETTEQFLASLSKDDTVTG